MWLIGAFRCVGKLLVVFVVLASIALNVSMLMVSGVYATASAVLSGIGVTTVAAREAGASLAARQTTQRIARRTAAGVTLRARRGAVRSITSVGAKAMPVIGVAVLAGALALEVRDACATAADMAGLEAALVAEGDAESARQAAIDGFDCNAMIREELPGYTDLPSRDAVWADIRESPAAAWTSAKEYMPDLPDFSDSYAASLTRITGLACLIVHCETERVPPE